MATQHLTAIPKGSLIIVTGVASYLASYTVKDLLQRGYRIRGTVRDLVQSAWLTEEVFRSFAQSGALELVQVPDLAAPDAFNMVIEGSGASAIMHFATPGLGDPDPHNVIPKAVDGILGLLRAASQEKSIRRFVYTSSIAAVFTPKAGRVGTATVRGDAHRHRVRG
ncbi:NAD(P)-binding protein [Thozetella sp. PMI_491]|nr:NAD(P)-binding protein [Thozetella sp. PMI_491]